MALNFLKFKDYRCLLLCPANAVLKSQPMASCMRGKHQTLPQSELSQYLLTWFFEGILSFMWISFPVVLLVVFFFFFLPDIYDKANEVPLLNFRKER